jgi:hypothetical protein
MFRYLFRPTAPCFCKDQAGRLGLFVPESDDRFFEIRAFSDKTRQLLLKGCEIGRRNPNAEFTDFSEACDAFLRETDGWDVFLAIRSTEEAADDEELCRWPVYAFARGSSPVRVLRIVERHDVGYDDSQIKAAHIFADVCSSLPPDHDIRRAYAFRAPPLSYEQTKDVWEQEAQALAETVPVNGEHRWGAKIRQWRECGFHPFLEGASNRLWTLAQNWFFDHPPTPPKDIGFLLTGIEAECWKPFVRKWAESNQTFDDDAAKNAVRELGWKQGSKRQRILREYVTMVRVRLADFRRD